MPPITLSIQALIPHIAHKRVETNLRQVIKQFFGTITAYNSLYSTWHTINNNITPLMNTLPIEVDWNRTFQILHNSTKMSCTFTNRKISTFRSYQMKLFHGKLPTMDVLHQRSSHVYKDSICKICEVEVEDNEHLWECIEHKPIIQLLTSEARSILYTPFAKIADPNLLLKALIGDVLNIFTPFDINIDNRNHTRDVFRTVLLRAYPTYTNPEIEFLIKECELFQVKHLIRGLVPAKISYVLRLIADYILATTELTFKESDSMHVFKTKQIYKHVSYTAIKHINNECFVQVWKPRCTSTIEWESDNDISSKDKRTFISNPALPRVLRIPKPSIQVLRTLAIDIMVLQYGKSYPLNHYLNPGLKPVWTRTDSHPCCNLLTFRVICRPPPDPPP